LDLHPDRFCILAALLGNYLLTEEDLADFYHKLGMNQIPGKVKSSSAHEIYELFVI
jgi:hypothetical protein